MPKFCSSLCTPAAPLVVIEAWAEAHGPGEDDVEAGYGVHPVVALRQHPGDLRRRPGEVQALTLDCDYGIVPYDDPRRHSTTYVNHLVQCDPGDEARIKPGAERLMRAARKRAVAVERAEPAATH